MAAFYLVQVINLNRATDRLKNFDEQARAAGFDYRRIEAIEGSEPGVQEITRGLKLEHWISAMRSNEVAVGLSHRSCWRNLLDSDCKATIIFEDDVVLAPGFETVLQDDWVPADADIVKLEAFPTLSIKVAKHVSAMVGGRKLQRLLDDHVGSAAYLVTRKGAEKLLNEVREISSPIDIRLFCVDSPLFHRCVIYQMNPAPCIQGLYVQPNAKWTQSSIQVPADLPIAGARPKQVECEGTTDRDAVARFIKRRARVRFFNRIKIYIQTKGQMVRGKIPFG